VTESEWQSQIIEIAHLLSWRVAHFRPARTNKGWRTAVSADGKGWPDLVLVRDRVVFAEAKVEKGRLDVEQEGWRDALLEAGAEWYVWRPQDVDEVLAVLRSRATPRS
jgi:hypothetical protein